MRTVDYSDATPSISAVLVDNTLIRSAGRLLELDYDTPEIRMYPGINRILFMHDLFALASLCESIVLADEIYCHAAFARIWRGSDGLGHLLEDCVVGLTFDQDLLDLAAPALPKLDNQLGLGLFARRAAEIVYEIHHGDEPLPHNSRRLFLDPLGEVPSDRTRSLLAGTAFYLFASQLLGIPYRPSALRAEMLRQRTSDELVPSVLPDPPQILEEVLERGREAALADLVQSVRVYFDHTLEINNIRLVLPNIFMAILAECNTPGDVLPQAMNLRYGDGASELRSTLGELTWQLRAGEIPKARKFFKLVSKMTDNVNRDLGLSQGSEVEVSLQYGPVSVGPLFSVPALVGRSARYGRQLLFLREQYKRSVRARSAGEQVERLFISRMPT